MKTIIARAGGGLTAALVASAALLAGAAPTASAAVIHACVKPGGGATRIVGAKAKCRHGEHMLKWSVSGPAGPVGPAAAGQTGAQGAPGKDGEGSLFSASAGPSSDWSGEAQETLVSKIVPPGSFMVWAKTALEAETTTPLLAEDLCELIDQPGTSGTGEPAGLDLARWEQMTAKPESLKGAGNAFAVSSLALQGAFTSSVTSTLSLVCSTFNSVVNSGTKSLRSQLQAMSVSAIG